MESIPLSALNDPNPWVIAIYGIGFAAAFVINLFAIYRMVTLDHIRQDRRSQR